MRKAVIIHGTLAGPDDHWFPWLHQELKNLGYQVSRPKFPTPENQTIKNWLEILDQHIKECDQDTILIGHSSGPLAICAKLQQLKSPIKAAFFVAPFLGNIGNTEYDQVNSDFIHHDYKWDKVKQAAGRFFIYRAKDDPYVPKESGRKLAQKINAKETVFKSGGHLNSEAGFNTFPELLEDIKSLR